jgi:hypothetical protein
MSRIPNNKNYIQATLYHSGEKSLGHDMANVVPDSEVRKAGLSRFGKLAGKAAAVGAGVALMAASFVSAIDRSPTTQKFIDKEEQEQVPEIETSDYAQPIDSVPESLNSDIAFTTGEPEEHIVKE